jgi:hypothetical protein
VPAWIHERAKHILAKNKDATKQMAFGIATQQAHALGKSPKGYGTEEGREKAKAKYKTPDDDKRSANPGKLKSPKLAHVSTFLEALLKEAEANVGQWWEQVGGPFLSKGGDHGTFKSMMAEAEIPSAFQGKLLRLAEQKYPPGYNQPGGPPAQLSGLLPGLLGIGLIGGVAGLHAYRKHRQEKEEKRKAASMGFLTPEFLAAFEGELNKIGEGLPAMSSYSSSDFRRSQYSGPLGPGGFKQESLVPGMRVQSLGSAVEKPKTASMTSMLRVPESTFKPPSLKPPSVQSPATKPPVASGSKGPTIADVATPKPLTASFDNMKPGALKMTPLPGTKTEHV